MIFRRKVQHRLEATQETKARQNEYIFTSKHSQSIRHKYKNDGDVVSKGNLIIWNFFLSVSEKKKKHISN